MEMSKSNELTLISASIFPEVNFSKIVKTKHSTFYSGILQQPQMQRVQKKHAYSFTPSFVALLYQ